ncbi:MAG: GNAT family N-acetyltransferase [Nitrospira sp.]|nr:GNAT family N-acetyltransferase [Nitrospira sp.]
MFSGNIFSSIESVGLDARGWNVLALKSPTRTIFQTYQWLWSWEKIFKDQCEPLYIVVDSPDGSGIEAVAPLMITKEFLGQRTVKFVGDGKADYCDLLFADGRFDLLEKLFEHLFAVRERWDCIQLNSIPTESPTIRGIQRLCSRYGCRMFQRDLYASPTLLIKGQEENALRVFNKYSLRRRLNYFQRQGRLTFKTVQGSEVMSYLDGFFSQHIARWAGTGSPSLFLDEKNRSFYRELAQALCRTGWLVLSIVELDRRPLAMHVGFDYEGKLLWYKPSFDPAYAKHSPGLVLLRYLIGYVIEQKRDEFDFSIGDEPFKQRFCNCVRTTVQVQVFKDSFTYALAQTRQKLGSIKRALHGKNEENRSCKFVTLSM